MTVRTGLLLSASTLLVVLGVASGVLLAFRHNRTAHPFVFDKAQLAQAAENRAISQRALQAARTQLRAVRPEIKAYAADHGNSYLGMTTARLRAQSKRPLIGIEIVFAFRSGYCAESTVDGYGVVTDQTGLTLANGGCAA